MPTDPPAPALGAQYSVDEKREAFAAWDRYKEQLDQAIRDLVPNVPVRGQNPMFPVLFADGYLRGKAAQAAQLANQAEAGKVLDALRADLAEARAELAEAPSWQTVNRLLDERDAALVRAPRLATLEAAVRALVAQSGYVTCADWDALEAAVRNLDAPPGEGQPDAGC